MLFLNKIYTILHISSYSEPCISGSSLSEFTFTYLTNTIHISISDKLELLTATVPLLPRCSATSVRWVRNRGRGQRSDTGACSWRRCRMPSTCLRRTSSCRPTTNYCVKVSARPPHPDTLRLNVMGISRDDSCAAKLCSFIAALAEIKEALTVRGDPKAELLAQK